MLPKLRDYQKVAGKEIIERIRAEAEPLRGIHVTHVNSTYVGGGVAELLNSLVIPFNELGIEMGWRLLKGSHTFFNITKRFHNSLQGDRNHLSDAAKRIYFEEIEKNAMINHLYRHDMVIIHDPQPLAMIEHYPRGRPWLWRCHVDITNPDPEFWAFLRPFILKYDGMIVSMKEYMKGDIPVPQFVRPPSLDPLSLKNKKLSRRTCRRLISEAGIDPDRPIMCQVSRFDKWKNPLGVVRMHEAVKERMDCQLVLIGDMASDDPEGPVIYNRLLKKVSGSCDGIHLLTQKNDLLVNALQSESAVVVQNSVREGFGMTVTEALFKETPVVASRVGGIPLQVIDGETGFLIRDPREGAKRCLQLLADQGLRERMGRNGREHVMRNFLITGHILDYIGMFRRYLKPDVSCGQLPKGPA
jgi:trehalose synthase